MRRIILTFFTLVLIIGITDLAKGGDYTLRKKSSPAVKRKSTAGTITFKYTRLIITNYTKKTVMVSVNFFKNGIHLVKKMMILYKNKGKIDVDNGSDVNISYISNGKNITRIVKAKGKSAGVTLRP